MQRMEKHKTDCKIAYAVGYIKKQARCPIGESGFNAAGNEIRQSAKGAECQSEEARKNAPEKSRTVLTEEQNSESQYAPDVEIAEPPHPKAVTEALQKYEGIYDEENFFSACEGVEDDEQAHHFNIGQECQKKLSQKQYGGKKP